MITIVDKTLTTEDTDTHTGVITRMVLNLTTGDGRISEVDAELKAVSDNFILLEDITDQNLIDWCCARRNMTINELAAWHETIPTVEG